MSAWPMQARNKIIDSKIEDAIQRAVEPDGSDEIKEAAQAVSTILGSDGFSRVDY